MRKIIQICAIPCGSTPITSNAPALLVLCNDHTVWQFYMGNWTKVPEIPQKEFMNHTHIKDDHHE